MGPREAGLVIDFARSLAAHAAALTPELAGAATDSLCLMLGATLASLRDAGAPPPAVAAGRARARAAASIEENLEDRGLSSAAIAAGAGLSRRALSRAGEPRTIDELANAAGFTSPGHAGRVFRDAFGILPGAYRRDVHAASSPGTVPTGGLQRASPPVGLAAWHGELL